jgi:hypothetical protein
LLSVLCKTLRERFVQIFGSAPRVIDRSHWGTGSTYESANKVGSHPADAALLRRDAAGEPGRSAAIPALRSEGFGSTSKVSDPRASDTLMQMRGDNGARADHASVFAAYSEND